MEKSQVRQFTGLGSSSFGFGSRSGLRSPVKDLKNLAESRIQNLPSYKRDDLSKRTEMIVIFQTIEIERLSTEIESLRVELKDSRRQLNNYLNYEVQIKELTENSINLELENQSLREELDKMNKICQKMYSEMEESNHRNEEAIKEQMNQIQQKDTQIQHMNQQMQEMDKHFVESEREMSQQGESLKKELENSRQIIEGLKAHVQQEQNNNSNVLSEVAFLKQNQEKIEAENESLLALIDEKTSILDSLKKTVQQAICRTQENERSSQEFVKDLQMKNEAQFENIQRFIEEGQAISDGLRRQNEELLIQLKHSEDSFNNQLSHLKIQVKEQDQALKDLFKQLEEKSSIIERLQKEIQRVLTEQEQNSKVKERELQQKLEHMMSAFEKQQNEVALRNQQQAELMESELNKYQRQVNSLRDEVCRNQQELMKATTRNKDMKHQNAQNTSNLKAQQNEINQLSKQNTQLQRSKQELEAIAQDLDQKLKSTIEKFTEQSQLQIKEVSAIKEQTLTQSKVIEKQLRRMHNLEKVIMKLRESLEMCSIEQGEKIKKSLKKLDYAFELNNQYAQKIIKLQEKVALLENQNMNLTTDMKLINFEMVETHKINSMQKRRDSNRTSIAALDSTSHTQWNDKPSASEDENTPGAVNMRKVKGGRDSFSSLVSRGDEQSTSRSILSHLGHQSFYS